MTRLLGIDLGERRIGLAVGDTTTGAVRPLATLRRREPEADARTVSRRIDEQGIEELVIGLPSNMDGSEGPQALATRDWGGRIAAATGLPVAWRDERLTSEAAEAALGRMRRARTGGPPTGARRASHRAAVDREAARLIVQREMDARSDTPPAPVAAVAPALGGRT